METQKGLPFILAEGDPWLQYTARRHLLGEPEVSLPSLRRQVLADPRICALLADLESFHRPVVSGHKNPELSVHKLLFLLDMGLGRDIPAIDAAVTAILSQQDGHGVFQSRICVPTHYGGSGEETFGWALCDAPLLAYALVRAGVDMEAVKPAVEHLITLNTPDSFPCAVSPELGKFRGPGKKSDPCPYANLIMLRLLLSLPTYAQAAVTAQTAEILLSLWSGSRNQHPYMFYMGTDFRKLKAPLIWYDLLSVADTLSAWPAAWRDPRFMEMIALIRSKANAAGRYTPESVYRSMADWDFGQKKSPSPSLTFLCLRLLSREPTAG